MAVVRRRKKCRRLAHETLEDRWVMADVSAPAFLQWFDASYANMENRLPDAFNVGYGSYYLPPPGRADISNYSVGYDVYDRHDLGGPNNPTLYGTETGLKTLIEQIHRSGGDAYVDLLLNHSGFTDLGTAGFAAAGGYPGFAITLPSDIDGDYHGAFEGGDTHMRLSGLVDIAQEKNYSFVRDPVPGYANNLPAGTTPLFGRLANVPQESNRRFYPDQQLDPITVFDPSTGESGIKIYPFNNANPQAGDPVAENAMGYLMRYAQWMVQYVGVDGFRIDAAKHFDPFVLNFLDRAVYRSSFRPLLDGSQRDIFSFSEAFDGSKSYLQSLVRKDINHADIGRIGGNRDVLDFALFFALRDNLTGNGFNNSWYNIRNAGLDVNDNGLHNGSEGVIFVQSHDEFGPSLANVAYAYALMQPGNAVVYDNAKEFGDNRNFPKDGRGDALGGLFGDAITKLVDIRNTHGRGNFVERWVEKEIYAFERQGSAVVLLSNRTDGGFDSRTIQTSFAPGTKLVELTGNANNSTIDPFNDLPELVVVNGDGTINVRFPRNSSAAGTYHGNGYLIYGLATPQGTLSLTGTSGVLPAETPTAATNGTARLTNIDIVTGDQFTVRLNTSEVNLLGQFRDPAADGDNALIQMDGGVDVNGNNQVDYVQPGNAAYGFENFTTKSSPRWTGGDGEFVQTISTANLSEGIHYITVRAFRHREPNSGEAVYQDFKRVIYIDRQAPPAVVASFQPIQAGVNENRDLRITSTDKTGNNVHLFLDIPANLTNNQVLALVNGASQSNKIDRELFSKSFNTLVSGNHVATIATYEVTGRVNVQRVPGLATSTIFGAGLGDLNFDGIYTPADITAFGTLLDSNNSQFNAAGDLNADGQITYADLLALGDRLDQINASDPTKQAFQDLWLQEFSAVDDNFQIFENQTLTKTAANGLFANDHRLILGAAYQLFAVTIPQTFTTTLGANVTLYADGSLTYAPFQTLTGGQVATDMVAYTVTDGFGNQRSAVAFVRVTGVNSDPTEVKFDIAMPSLDENQIEASVVGHLVVTDPDVGDTHTLTLGDSRFEVDSATGAVKLKAGQSVSLLAGASISLDVTATDALGGHLTRLWPISVKPNFPWHNNNNSLDVAVGGGITPLDALVIINMINSGASALQIPRPKLQPGDFFPDVDPTNRLTPLDALFVINYLNSHPAGLESGELGSDNGIEQAPVISGSQISSPVVISQTLVRESSNDSASHDVALLALYTWDSTTAGENLTGTRKLRSIR